MEWNVPMDAYIVLPDSRKGRRYAHAHGMVHGRMSQCNVCNRALMLRLSISQVEQAAESGIVMGGVL